ncbi:4'-phosphopantetheinyl transferase [Pseudooceanicola nitratireducens]|uniref:4'-phosphopantetheinyl transferase n=1 Tax=Pseudooceanicola nitratireducens TaxID=517719 RepID=A0A1I1Q4X0_9RHOB|nr:4'-phosphopantetheinyl transferase [Pseudooceanicola nitratireducens]
MVAHALCRRMLAKKSGCRAQDLRFVVGPRGKPELSPQTTRRHLLQPQPFAWTGGRGDGTGTDLGVDVEERRHSAPFAITRDSFAPAERSCLEAAVPGDRHGMFYDIWTLKEAYMKGTGLAMLMALDSFAVCPDPPSMVIPSPDRARQRWVLSTWDVGPTHSLSLAVLAQAGGVPEVNVVPPLHL